MTSPRHREPPSDESDEGDLRHESGVPKARVSTVPPTSSPRRARLQERRWGAGSRARTSTARIRPWSQLPGVTAYLVLDPAGQLTDKWGDPGEEGIAKASAFRTRTQAGTLDGSFALEPAGDDLRLLSVARRDGWFVHVWLVGDADVTGVLAIISDEVA